MNLDNQRGLQSQSQNKNVAPGWHAQIAAELTREFAEANELSESVRRRRLRLGFMFIFAKEQGKADGSIPHGQFGAWLEANCPAIPRSTAGDYITEANSACDLLHWRKSEVRIFAPHRLLLARDEELAGADKTRKARLLELTGPQSGIRAVTEYKQAQLRDDATVGRRGAVKGSPGLTREMRLAARALVEKKRQELVKKDLVRITAWLRRHADARALVGVEDGAIEAAGAAARTFADFVQRLQEARRPHG